VNRNQQVNRILHQVWDYSSADAAAVLQEACDGDRELLQEVKARLQVRKDVATVQAARARQQPPAQRRARTGSGGNCVSRYELRMTLCSGGFGMVDVAFDPWLERHVAIKRPKPGALVDGDGSSFFHEAKAAAQLRHPYIVPIYDVGYQEDGTPFLVAEFVEGESLAARLKSKGPFEARAAAVFMSKVDQAVRHAHSRHVVHGDLTPANILVDTDGNPRITDFGLARRIDREHRMRVGGTLPYMAPGLLDGSIPLPTEETDLWAVGVMYYEMLTGKRPFDVERWKGEYRLLPEQPVPPRRVRRSVPRCFSRHCMELLRR
jgi:serine/threonine-protein kinase